MVSLGPSRRRVRLGGRQGGSAARPGRDPRLRSTGCKTERVGRPSRAARSVVPSSMQPSRAAAARVSADRPRPMTRRGHAPRAGRQPHRAADQTDADHPSVSTRGIIRLLSRRGFDGYGRRFRPSSCCNLCSVRDRSPAPLRRSCRSCRRFLRRPGHHVRRRAHPGFAAGGRSPLRAGVGARCRAHRLAGARQAAGDKSSVPGWRRPGWRARNFAVRGPLLGANRRWASMMRCSATWQSQRTGRGSPSSSVGQAFRAGWPSPDKCPAAGTSAAAPSQPRSM